MNGIAPLLSSWNTHLHTRVSTSNNIAIYPVFSTRIIVVRLFEHGLQPQLFALYASVCRLHSGRIVISGCTDVSLRYQTQYTNVIRLRRLYPVTTSNERFSTRTRADFMDKRIEEGAELAEISFQVNPECAIMPIENPTNPNMNDI